MNKSNRQKSSLRAKPVHNNNEEEEDVEVDEFAADKEADIPNCRGVWPKNMSEGLDKQFLFKDLIFQDISIGDIVNLTLIQWVSHFGF